MDELYRKDTLERHLLKRARGLDSRENEKEPVRLDSDGDLMEGKRTGGYKSKYSFAAHCMFVS